MHLQWTPAKKKGEWHHALCLMMASVLALLQARRSHHLPQARLPVYSRLRLATSLRSCSFAHKLI